LLVDINSHLNRREDIWVDDSVSPDLGCPAIRGIKLKRIQETEVRGPDSYHPYEFKGWKYYGLAFAIETDIAFSRTPFTKDQMKWRDDFEVCGGVYIEARNIANVFEVLGKSRPEPWDEYLDRVIKIK